jgi:uncharacterized membrane protein YuzA (DUF378 family)
VQNLSSYFSSPAQLERTGFLWSEARLALAALALFLNGVPPAVYLFGYAGPVWSIVKVAWIISGVASAYLLYRWYTGGQKVFGGTARNDVVAFAVSVISGLNLGWTGLTGSNVGMSIASGRVIFVIVGVLYVWAGVHLWRRWKARGEHLF